MSFFATLRNDLNIVWDKVKSAEHSAVNALVTSAESGAIHNEVLTLFERLLSYVEAHIPEEVAVVGGVVGGPVGAAVGGAVGTVTDKVVQAVKQAIDPENPK